MKSSDIALSVIIILIFVIIYVFNVLSVGIKNIQDNWPTYRCNPMVMPFAEVFGHEIMSNFTFCIQGMQTDYMKYLLQPLDYNFSVITNLGESLSVNINSIRAFFSKLRTMISDIIGNIFGVFLNILIEFQRVIINVKDLFGKVIGILATLLYTVSGSIMTMESTWAGPPGQMVRALCFEPNTTLMTQDGLVPMKDIKLGTKLKNGSRVCAVMQISNIDKEGKHIENIYKIEGGENNKPIFVSGSHLVYEPELQEFVAVKDLRGKTPSLITDKKCSVLSCLITSDHSIPIGQWIFHDWEDNNGSISKNIK
tara:strand:- start:2316 stop:3245 length:930 start_codon:yes stop_codon:yes gene_type:complete